MSDFRTFLVPYDFSEHARAALRAAVDLARRLDARIHLVHVLEPPTYAYGGFGAPGHVPFDLAEIRNGAVQALREVADGIEGLPVRAESHLVEGAGIAARIHDAAKEYGADLIVMGTHGRTGLAHVFLGSVAERTLRGAPCPVLTVQSPDEKGESD